MIAARIGLDRFLVWRLPLARAVALVPGTMPLEDADGAWLLFAAARLERVRVAGLPLPGTRQVAAWLVPCRAADGSIGNAFVSAFSDDPAVVLAMRAIGMRARQTVIRHAGDGLRVVGEVAAAIGGPAPLPGLAWFAADRCGLLAGRGGVRRLPLVKRSWAWRTRSARLVSPFAGRHAAVAVGAIDCSGDLARWGLPRRA